jgi:hypothetical protein
MAWSRKLNWPNTGGSSKTQVSPLFSGHCSTRTQDFYILLILHDSVCACFLAWKNWLVRLFDDSSWVYRVGESRCASPPEKMEYNLAVAHNSDFRPLHSYFRQGACLTGRPREQRAVPGPNSLLFSLCCLMAHIKNKREFCRRALAARSCRVSQTWHRMVEMGFNIQMIQ